MPTGKNHGTLPELALPTTNFHDCTSIRVFVGLLASATRLKTNSSLIHSGPVMPNVCSTSSTMTMGSPDFWKRALTLGSAWPKAQAKAALFMFLHVSEFLSLEGLAVGSCALVRTASLDLNLVRNSKMLFGDALP